MSLFTFSSQGSRAPSGRSTNRRSAWGVYAGMVALMALVACGSSDTNNGDSGPTEWPCEIPNGSPPPDFVQKTGCTADFQAMASEPLDSSLPGARSGKVVLDLRNSDALYFQNSNKYEIHYKFALEHLNSDRSITTISTFNPEYTAVLDQRRFLLGAVTYYEAPKVWALEIAPYDTSTPEMIARLFNAVKKSAFYGSALMFHPTSETIEAQAKKLGSDIPIKTTNDLFAAIDYQPLNTGEAVGTLKFINAADLANIYVNSREVVVLDEVPNDISPTAALITQQFQTPLSHINVLARNRKTPNMGLRKAVSNPILTALKGKQVRLTVNRFDWKIAEVTQAESDAWWEAHKPKPVVLPALDLDVKDLRDIATVTEHTDTSPYVTLAAIQAATRAFGAKAANYSVFATDKEVPNKKGFAIPVLYYYEFMEENGFHERVRAFRADPDFVGKEEARSAKLTELRNDILKAPFNANFQALLKAKLDADFKGKSMRFRSSTNAEDLDGFPCAGCYDSHTGDPNDTKYMGDQLAAVLDAIRKTWATVWSFRTYEERQLHSIDHTGVAMALLVHTNFPDEEANGVAVTSNIFDTSGNAPGFYVNVQRGGEFEVVHPPPGITSDSFLYQFSFSGQPVIYYTHSNVVAEGAHVLGERQIYDLGVALDIIHKRFTNAYQTSPTAWYAMDVEFKFDDEANPGSTPSLYIKQARPYPGQQQ
jgi:pyruvate,water dikinase